MIGKQCKLCRETKPINEFYSTGWSIRVDGSKIRTYRPSCKLCANAVQRETFYKKLNALKGPCIRCGYDTYKGAIDFHHKDPKEKDFSISSRQVASEATFLREVKKCVPVCRNCHAELHAGIWNLKELGL